MATVASLDPLSPQEAVGVERCLVRLARSQDKYRLYRDYYEGDHRLAFATDKYRTTFGNLFAAFADNLCPAVVDAVADRLQVTDWSVSDQSGTTNQALKDRAQELWDRNRMDMRSGEVHTESLREGDAYVLVWADGDGRAGIWPQRADQCMVEYDPESPGTVLVAVKVWRIETKDDNTGGRWRVNVYTADRLVKYVTRNPQSGWRAANLVPWEVQGEAWPLSHNLGRVPVVPFANNASPGQYGVSELRDVIPLQDALNKSVADMMVAMEYVALPQRYATGIEVPTDENGRPVKDWKPGIDRLWSTPATDAKFGEFGQANLAQFLAVQDGFRAEVARVSATPFHYLMLTTGDFPSGEAMKTAEQRFVSKVRDRMKSGAVAWSQVMALALDVEGAPGDLEPDYQDPAPKSEKDHLDALKVKADLGVPQEVLWAEMGYTEDEIASMSAQSEARRTTLADSMAAALNAGM